MSSDDGQTGGADERKAGSDGRTEDAESDGMGWENEQYPGLCGGDCVKKDCLCVECRVAF